MRRIAGRQSFFCSAKKVLVLNLRVPSSGFNSRVQRFWVALVVCNFCLPNVWTSVLAFRCYARGAAVAVRKENVSWCLLGTSFLCASSTCEGFVGANTPADAFAAGWYTFSDT